MSFKNDFLVGLGAVYVGDLVAPMLPTQLNFGGFPIAAYLASGIGAYVGEKIAGSSVGLGHALLLGITAKIGADLKSTLASTLTLTVPVIGDITRPIAGALALAGAKKLGIEKGP